MHHFFHGEKVAISTLALDQAYSQGEAGWPLGLTGFIPRARRVHPEGQRTHPQDQLDVEIICHAGDGDHPRDSTESAAAVITTQVKKVTSTCDVSVTFRLK